MSATVSSQSVTSDAVVLERALRPMWWLWLVTGIIWLLAALVILQFDSASVSTVGIIIGCLFVFAGAQELLAAFAGAQLRWLGGIFGGLFLIAGVICFINPKNTFAAMADILGFLFLTVGIWWTITAFLQRAFNDAWWLTLISGILMIAMAFWTSGQFFIQKSYTLLVFAGIWALMHGITDIVRAFQIRRAEY